VTTDFASAAEQCNGLAFQADQSQLKIVAVGSYAGGSTNHEYALARYNANGTLATLRSFLGGAAPVSPTSRAPPTTTDWD
jgi:hypothetical protein